MEFADSWLWLILLATGLFLVVLEVLIGVDTGLDLAITGSVFIIGGLITWPFESWVITAIVVSAISSAYLILGRRYVHHRMSFNGEKTNIDTIIGQTGVVLEPIHQNNQGLVKVNYEEWRARATEDIEQGDEVTVTSITGVTLTVEKIKGGDE